MKRRYLQLAMVLTLALAMGSPALAQSGRILDDNWYFTLGGYTAELSTDAQVGTGSLVGTLIRAEDELGLDDQKSTFQFLAERRLGQKHAVGLKYFTINRSGDRVLEDSIEFDGNTYDIGVSIASDFDTRLIELNYRYSFVNDGKTEAGIQAGLATWKLSASLAGDASVDDGMGGQATAFTRAGEDLLAPVPNFGLFVRHAFTERLLFQASAGFLRVNVGDIEGRLIETSLTLDYFFSKHIGIGAGISGTDLRYEDKGNKPLMFEYRQNGFVGYLSAVF